MRTKRLRCEEVIERLFDYLDRELDQYEAADIEEHLLHCRDCFSRAEFERLLRAKLAASASHPAPRRLQRRVSDLLDNY